MAAHIAPPTSNGKGLSIDGDALLLGERVVGTVDPRLSFPIRSELLEALEGFNLETSYAAGVEDGRDVTLGRLEEALDPVRDDFNDLLAHILLEAAVESELLARLVAGAQGSIAEIFDGLLARVENS